jgi:N-formylglutamate amidohydrolase
MVKINEYIEYQNGTIPLVISVSHGGMLECKDIPKRLTGVLGIDKNTIELTRDIIKSIEIIAEKSNYTEIKPSYIISHVRRNKIDLNRSISEAYDFNSALAGEIYQFYHEKLKEIIFNNLKIFQYSLLIDIHGFEAHKRPQGYRDVDLILGTNNLQSLFSTPIPKKDWNKNIRGKIINNFLDLNIPIAPGRQRRVEYVLKGGFTTLMYGASQIPNSQAIQIELSDRIRYQDKNLKKTVVSSLAEIFFDEILKHLIL